MRAPRLLTKGPNQAPAGLLDAADLSVLGTGATLFTRKHAWRWPRRAAEEGPFPRRAGGHPRPSTAGPAPGAALSAKLARSLPRSEASGRAPRPCRARPSSGPTTVIRVPPPRSPQRPQCPPPGRSLGPGRSYPFSRPKRSSELDVSVAARGTASLGARSPLRRLRKDVAAGQRCLGVGWAGPGRDLVLAERAGLPGLRRGAVPGRPRPAQDPGRRRGAGTVVVAPETPGRRPRGERGASF